MMPERVETLIPGRQAIHRILARQDRVQQGVQQAFEVACDKIWEQYRAAVRAEANRDATFRLILTIEQGTPHPA